MKQKIVALYGGSFDPIHTGHLAVIEESIRILDIEQLIVIPTFLNPFKTKSYTTPKKRLKLSNELFGKISKVLVSSYEIEQNSTTPTAQTLAYFQQQYDVKYIIIGADNLASITKWYNFNWLNSNIKWVIATRAGYNLETDALRDFKIIKVEIDISSTQIRDKETDEYR
jgi:nicotinate-nucleotide adenylyltransferase